jgi:hypothetical protein
MTRYITASGKEMPVQGNASARKCQCKEMKSRLKGFTKGQQKNARSKDGTPKKRQGSVNKLSVVTGIDRKG